MEGADPRVGDEVADVPVRGAVCEDVEVCEALCGVWLLVRVGCVDDVGEVDVDFGGGTEEVEHLLDLLVDYEIRRIMGFVT